MRQDTAFELLKEGHNIFLTGPAGSGKTFLLNRYIKYLNEQKIGVAVTASTGIAATHINGRTIHSWSGIGIKNTLTEKEIRNIVNHKILAPIILSADVLIIDEISMLHAHQLDLVNTVLRRVRGNWEPFGGIQVIFSGDFFQLPPVTKELINKPKFAFESGAWKELDVQTCYLSEQFRQEDGEIVGVLNAIRENRVSTEIVEILRRVVQRSKTFITVPTKLYTHNFDVDAINNHELAKINNPSVFYDMYRKGIKGLIASLIKGCLAPSKLELKEGALVMFVQNNFEMGYVNGTIGKVIGFDEENYPIVEILSSKIKVHVRYGHWTFEKNEEVLAEISQIPLRLAWAITVHKSQGMTLDSAEIDLSKSFEYGMGYVALSRVKTLDHLRLLGFNDMSLRVNPVILEKDKLFKRSSDEFELKLQGREAQPMIRNNESDDKAYCVEEIRKEHANAYKPWTRVDDEKLVYFYDEGKTIAQLTELFHRQRGGIRSRVMKLKHIDHIHQ